MAGAQATASRGAVSIVGALRTPFVPPHTGFAGLSLIELARRCTGEVIDRFDIDGRWIEQLVVETDAHTLSTDLAREVLLGTSIDPRAEATTMGAAAAGARLGLQPVLSLVDAIEAGTVTSGLAVGVRVAPPLPGETGVRRWLLRAREELGRVPSALTELPLRGRELELVERSSRAARSSWDEGMFEDEVMTVYVPPEFTHVVDEDVPIARQQPSWLLRSSLDPVRRGVPRLADGAAAVVLMRTDVALQRGLSPLATITGCRSLGGGTANAPAAARVFLSTLSQRELELADLSLIEWHESGASELLHDLDHVEMMAGAGVDPDRLNVCGGTLAFGDAGAASGLRLLLQASSELGRRGGGVAACVAGGVDQATAVLLEVES